MSPDTVTNSQSPAASAKPEPRSVQTPGVRLLLLCHAEGMQDRYANLPVMNTGLTAAGWEQAEKLAFWLRTHETIDVLYCGPLLQSRLTAQRVGQALGLPASVVRDLPTLPRRAAAPCALDGEAARRLYHHGERPAPSPEEAAQRETLIHMVDDLLVQNWGRSIALVTSVSNITALLNYVLGANCTELRLANTSITELSHADGMWRVDYVNRREHLPLPAHKPAEVRPLPAAVAEQQEDLLPVIAVYNRVAKADIEQKVQDDRLRIRHLLDFAQLPQGLRALDIGTGLGVLAVMLAEEGASQVIGVDISPGMLEQAEYLRLSRPTPGGERVSFRLAPAQELPFVDESFDLVTSRLLLNHTRTPERIVREAVRVLKPGGILLLAELQSVENPVKRATQNAIEEKRNPSHVAARSSDQYDKLVTDAGMEIAARQPVSLERELEEWLAAYRTDKADGVVVREMLEASLETDAAGINARRRGNTIDFLQRMYYLKAVKPAR